MMCPQCGSSDLRLAVAVWLATSIDDPDNHDPDLPEHQCMACGLSFWCGLDMASLTEPDFSRRCGGSPCVGDNKMARDGGPNADDVAMAAFVKMMKQSMGYVDEVRQMCSTCNHSCIPTADGSLVCTANVALQFTVAPCGSCDHWEKQSER